MTPRITAAPIGRGHLLALEGLMAIERMHPIDPFEPEPPHTLPAGARVELMMPDGQIMPWQWADAADWSLAAGWRPVLMPGFGFCEDCDEFREIAAYEELAGTLCDDCARGYGDD